MHLTNTGTGWNLSTKVAPFVVIFSMALSACTTPTSHEVVRIGHAGPLSGPTSDIGRDVEMGAQLAVEQINSRRLIVANMPLWFELISMDDAGDPNKALGVAKSLANRKVTAVVGHLNSGTTIPAAEVYNSARIPQFSPSASHPKFTQMGLEKVFRMVADDIQVADELGQYAFKKLSARRIIIIDDRTPYGKGLSDSFEASLGRLNVKAISRQFTHTEAKSFNEILDALESQEPDLVFFGGIDRTFGALMLLAKHRNFHPRWMVAAGACSQKLPQLAGGLADDQVYCSVPGGVVLRKSAKDGVQNRRREAR